MIDDLFDIIRVIAWAGRVLLRNALHPVEAVDLSCGPVSHPDVSAGIRALPKACHVMILLAAVPGRPGMTTTYAVELIPTSRRVA